jgi:Leucine-rich repeat (LRR) protein
MTDATARQLIAKAKDQQWEELDLAGMELEELPPEIDELTQLKRLCLGKLDQEKGKWIGNRLTGLPDELGKLINLTAVYQILDNQRVRKNLGQFNDQDLADIWQADEYTNMRHELLQLMKEFKVCHEIPRRKGEYIAPHLLSQESPCYERKQLARFSNYSNG